MAKVDSKGFWVDSSGEGVHPDLIKADEKIKDELVGRLVEKSLKLQKEMVEFKKYLELEIDRYFDRLLKEYNLEKKERFGGSFRLEDFSGLNRFEARVGSIIDFDEKIKIAKLKIDDYLQDLTKDSSAEIKTLISNAFEVDKDGKFDSKKILSLKKYNIKDSRWVEAMEIIESSKKVRSKKSYFRLYVKENHNSDFKLVNLNFSSL